MCMPHWGCNLSFSKVERARNFECLPLAKLIDTSIVGGNVAEYAKHLFRAFDTDVDGYVSFEEVIVGFHHLSGSGDEREKMKIVFRVSNEPTM